MTQFCPNTTVFAKLCALKYFYLFGFGQYYYIIHMATVLYILVHPIHVCCKCASL